jgi:hypothetical protein
LHLPDFRRSVRTQWVGKHGDGLRLGNEITNDFQSFLSEQARDQHHAGRVAARPVEARDQPGANRIEPYDEDDRDRSGCDLCRQRGWRPRCHNERHGAPHHLAGQHRQAIVLTVDKMVVDCDIAAINISGLAKAALERSDHVTGLHLRDRAEKPNHRHHRLLRVRRHRYGRGRAAEQCDEFAASHVEHRASSRLAPLVSLPQAQPAAEGPASPWGRPELF